MKNLKEDKELLLQDLCTRLSYNLIVQIEGCGIWNLRGIDHDDSSELRDRVIVWHGKNYPSSKNSFPIIDCKPFLFPLSSMTDEQRKEYHELIGGMFGTSVLINFAVLEEFFHKNHLDYRDLIKKGLAIDCTNLNIY